MNFEAAVQYLLGLGHETLTMKLGLRNTELLLSSLGNPQVFFPSVQIAGTNGKGSVAAFLNSICLAANIRTGLYSSPHLVSITERIQIEGKEITPDDFARVASAVRCAADELLRTKQIDALPTFFEQVTVIALVAFRNAQVELAVLEAGLGGRLDSTTVADAQFVGITSIDFDHEEYLGDTIERISAEKAAIIRPGTAPVVAMQKPEALKVIVQRCEACNVTPVYDECRTEISHVGQDGISTVTFKTATDIYENVIVGLRGRHQIENASIAIQLAEQLRKNGFGIPRQAIIEGIQKARHPGRLELFEGHPAFLFDGAHNPAGARVLASYLQEFATRPLVLLFGAMKDKRLDQMASTLFPIADHVVLTEIGNPRSASGERFSQLARAFPPEGTTAIVESSNEALRLAIDRAGKDGLVCVTGSLYLIGELRPLVLNKIAASVAAQNESS